MSRARIGRNYFTTMFKSASIFKITLPDATSFALHKAAQAFAFTPLDGSQERSVGWVPPRGHEHGAMAENIGGQLIMRLMVETKSVPAQAVADKVAAQIKHIEATTGRKPGKRETRELKEDARLALLPMAFAKRSATMVWIDPAAGLLVVDSASYSRLDEVTMQLVRMVEGIVITPLVTNIHPEKAMAEWLIDNDTLGSDLSIGRACSLKAFDESKAVVRYNHHPVDTEEVCNHIQRGKVPTALELIYAGRVPFVLTNALTLTKLNFLGVVFENAAAGDTSADSFDADVAILTGELKPLIKYLVAELGGELVVEGEAA